MIVRDLATLSVESEHRTAREIAAVMGLEATEAHERGDLTRAARRGTVLPGRSRFETRALWSLDGDEDAADPHDETGFRTLRQLLSRVSGKAAEIADLKRDCDVSITWSGFSDSWHGGFVLDEDLLSELGRLGIPIWGTTYVNDDADADDSGETRGSSSRNGFLRALDAVRQRHVSSYPDPRRPPDA